MERSYCFNLHFLVEYVFHLYGPFLLLLHELPTLIFWLFFYQEIVIFLSAFIVSFYIMFINSLCTKIVANIFSSLSFTFNFYDFCTWKKVLFISMYYSLLNSLLKVLILKYLMNYWIIKYSSDFMHRIPLRNLMSVKHLLTLPCIYIYNFVFIFNFQLIWNLFHCVVQEAI